MSDEVRVPILARCPYYLGIGTCGGSGSCDYYGEPTCITDEPREGWLARDTKGRYISKKRQEEKLQAIRTNT